MKLSVILPVHNAQEYINDTLKSLMDNVGFCDYEIIFVDAHSQDDSERLIKGNTCLYIQAQDKIIYCKIPTSYACDVYNKGLSLATGDYIYFLMPGDKVCPGFLEDAVNWLDAYNIDIYTRNFIEHGVNTTASYDDLHIGPMLATTVIRRSSIDIQFEGYACPDAIFTTRMLVRGAMMYHDQGYNSVEYNNDAYQWLCMQSDQYLENIECDWLQYIYRYIDCTDDKINVSIHVANRCNKNCVACGHFSPLVPKDDPDMTLDDFIDSTRYLIPFKNSIRTLILTGGEPTLNPNLPEIIEVACSNFHHVRLVSNGLNPEFFKKYKELIEQTGIEVYVTKYSEQASERIKQELEGVTHYSGYSIRSLEDESGVREYFYSKMLSDSRIEDINLVGKCARGECAQLVGSKLYICQYTANFKYFDNFFSNHPLPKVEDSYIDLELPGVTYKDIRKFIYEHNPLICWYCKEPYIQMGKLEYINKVPLTKSKCEISEWVG